MNIRCRFESFDGRLCKRWAVHGSNFCYNHQPPSGATFETAAHLHPLARLADPQDVFDVLRETLNAVRLGRINPARANSVARVAEVLLRVREMLPEFQRDAALYRQFIPTLADEDTSAETEALLSPPLPLDSADPAPAALPGDSASPRCAVLELADSAPAALCAPQPPPRAELPEDSAISPSPSSDAVARPLAMA